jgi:hypothetical protein
MTPEQLDAELAIFNTYCKRNDISLDLAADLWPAWYDRSVYAHQREAELTAEIARLRDELSPTPKYLSDYVHRVLAERDENKTPEECLPVDPLADLTAMSQELGVGYGQDDLPIEVLRILRFIFHYFREPHMAAELPDELVPDIRALEAMFKAQGVIV